MSSIVPKGATGVDNTARKKWDAEEFAEQAKKRELEEDETADLTPYELKQLKRRRRDPLHQGQIVRRDNLQSRDYQLDLSARLNKTQVISSSTPLNHQAGYYCSVCDCILRDSASYLDHINGKYHNRALGMTMRVERVGLDSVKQRIEKHKLAKEEAKREDYVPDGFEKRVTASEAEEERQREAKKEKKRLKKEAAKAPAKPDLLEGAEELDPELAAMMGFKGFGKQN